MSEPFYVTVLTEVDRARAIDQIGARVRRALKDANDAGEETESLKRTIIVSVVPRPKESLKPRKPHYNNTLFDHDP